MRASVPDIPAEQFATIAADAKANCPVSRALRVAITMDAQLEGAAESTAGSAGAV